MINNIAWVNIPKLNASFAIFIVQRKNWYRHITTIAIVRPLHYKYLY